MEGVGYVFVVVGSFSIFFEGLIFSSRFSIIEPSSGLVCSIGKVFGIND